MVAAPIDFKIYPYPLTNLTITRVYGGTTQSITATHSGSNNYYDVSTSEGSFTISADGYETVTVEQYVAGVDVTLVEDLPDNIADAITAAQGRVADCYTAISGKGGTLPVTQNLANMPTAINSISGKVALSIVIWCPSENQMSYSRIWNFIANSVSYPIYGSFTQQDNPSVVPSSKGSLMYGIIEFDKNTVVNWSIDSSSKVGWYSSTSGTITMDASKTLLLILNYTID